MIKFIISFIFFSFTIFASWEFIQTPFFIDVSTNINTIVWYRIHCSLGDILILVSTIVLTSIIYKFKFWETRFGRKHYVLNVILGLFYTTFSEFKNVHIYKSWSYSELMPVVFGIGIIPLIQWLVLPPLIIFITGKFLNLNRIK